MIVSFGEIVCENMRAGGFETKAAVGMVDDRSLVMGRLLDDALGMARVM